MRVIHLGRTTATGHVLPRCGAWGSMDTQWTDVAAGVTCVACREAMRTGARDGPPARGDRGGTGGRAAEDGGGAAASRSAGAKA